MNFQSNLIRTAVLGIAFILMGFTVSNAQTNDEFSFKVTNNTNTTIKKLLVSQDGKKYGYFDIGKGIGAGQTVTLVWDKSTNEENCIQYFKAVYSDGSESAPAKFDFCEDELELEFNE